MKVLKKILSIVFNPLNSISIGKANEKAATVFSKYAVLVFIVALLVTGGILALGYFGL
jgi:hypothetical protein